MKMDVSVCIPVYNERDALKSTVKEIIAAMQQLEYSFEVIVIDDGSTDGCTDLLKGLKVKVIRHRRNFGGGVARVTGMRYAKGDIILQTDADGSYPCAKIPEILARMKSADMVVGARVRESAKDWKILRIFTKWCMRKTATIISNHKIPDLNSGMRAYSRVLGLRYQHLYPKGHSIMSTITLAFMTEGCKVEFVNIDYRQRIGKSSFHPVKDTFNYFITIVRTISTFNPFRIYLPVSFVFILSSIGWGVRDYHYRGGIGSVTPILFIFGILIIIFAVFSDQMSRLSRQIGNLTNSHLEEGQDFFVEKKRRSKNRR